MNSPTLKKNERIISFDILRIIAILAVVMIHTTAPSFYNAPVNSIEFYVATILNSFARPAVPIFVMISGSLMLDETKILSNKKILKKAVFLFSVLCFWSFFYAVYTQFNDSNSSFSLSSFIKAFMLGHYHLWFLYMIIGLYLITPLLRLFIKKQNLKLIIYFISLSIIFQFSLPVVNLILNKVLPLSLYGVYSKFINSFMLKFVGGYTTYYLLGWFISAINLKKSYRLCIYATGVLSLILIFVGTIFFSSNTLKYETLLSNTNIAVLAYSLSIFCLIFYVFKNKKINSKLAPLVFKLSNLTFGVFLIHDLFISLLSKHFSSYSLGFIGIKFILFWIITTLLSFMTSFIISKIPYIKKIIKG